MTWTQFHDMHSGGNQKLEWSQIFIEAPEDEAVVIFQNAFDRDPHNVTCHCCGADYSLTDAVNLAQATGYERGCRYLTTPRSADGLYVRNDPVLREHYYLEDDEEPPPGYAVEVGSLRRFRTYIPLADYVKRPDVKIIPASEIRPEWRVR